VTSYLKQQKAAGATVVNLALKATNYTTPHVIVLSDEAAGEPAGRWSCPEWGEVFVAWVCNPCPRQISRRAWVENSCYV
jgi:hypothetical protein